jgi:signal transduction histidine kinase
MSTAATFTLAEFRAVDLFDETSDEELEEWLAVAKLMSAEPGDILVEQGVEPPGLLLLLEGTAQAQLSEGGRIEPVGRHYAPTWMGAIAALTEGPLRVQMRAETPCRIALIETEDFRRLAMAQAAVHSRVMRMVQPVMRQVTATEQNRERLAALGTMAAGLAHELNNPAAAARRAAAQMAEAIDTVAATIGRFVEGGISRDDAQELVHLQREALARAKTQSALEALDAADAEDDLLARLEELGVENAWELVEPLAAAGVDGDWVDRVHALAGPVTGDAVRWVAATLAARGLAEELQESTRRMSELVGAVKTYAYMDRGDMVEVDLHEGLETTLVVLGHKLKHTKIELKRDYDRSLPKLTVRGSELNQVWTNLIDNAIASLGESGTITIRTRRDGDCAIVDVEDDGREGIPPELQERIFDSFFTTKEVGHGTGLGLATARRIVVDRHDGSISVDSEPGRTTFHVSLPLTRRTR